MAKVYFVKQARKAYPEIGVEPGDSYYWWRFRVGGYRSSKAMPRRSQLQSSEKKQRIYAGHEEVDDALKEDCGYFEFYRDEVGSAIDRALSAVEEVVEEYRGAGDIVENFRDRYDEQANALEEFSSSIEDFRSNLESIDDTADDFDQAEAILQLLDEWESLEPEWTL